MLDNNESMPLRWTKLLLVLALAIVLVTVLAGAWAMALLSRHHRAVAARQVELAHGRDQAHSEAQRGELVSELLQSYLRLDTRALRERDRALELIQVVSQDTNIKQWAGRQRAILAPYLKRLPVIPPPETSGIPGGLGVTGGVEPIPAASRIFPDAGPIKRTPEWRKYLRVREQIRGRTGKHCCKIATGKVLFGGASSIKECRAQAQSLCTALARAAGGAEQKCFYSFERDCTGGELLAAGDVTSEAEKPAARPAAKKAAEE